MKLTGYHYSIFGVNKERLVEAGLEPVIFIILHYAIPTKLYSLIVGGLPILIIIIICGLI